MKGHEINVPFKNAENPRNSAQPMSMDDHLQYFGDRGLWTDLKAASALIHSISVADEEEHTVHMFDASVAACYYKNV